MHRILIEEVERVRVGTACDIFASQTLHSVLYGYVQRAFIAAVLYVDVGTAS